MTSRKFHVFGILLILAIVATLTVESKKDPPVDDRFQELCSLAKNENNPSKATALLKQAKTLSTQASQTFQVNKRLALTTLREGKTDDALHFLQENLQLAKAELGPPSEAIALLDLSWFFSQFGEHEKAQSFSEQAFTICNNVKDVSAFEEPIRRLATLYEGTDRGILLAKRLQSL